MLVDIGKPTRVSGLPKLRVSFVDIDSDLERVREFCQVMERLVPETDQPFDRHRWNNLLNIATLTLDVLYSQLESGRVSNARQSHINAMEAIDEVEAMLSLGNHH